MNPITLRFAKQCSDQSNYSPLMPLKHDKSSNEVILLIPGAGGNLLVYQHLYEHLSAMPHSIYGLLPRGWDGTQPPFKTMEDYLQHYLPAIQGLIETKKRIHVISWCFGSYIGCELLASIPTALRGKLFLIEAFAPPLKKMQKFKSGFIIHTIHKASKKPNLVLSKLQNIYRKRKRETALKRLLVNENKIPFDKRELLIHHHDAIIQQNYYLASYEGEIQLIWSDHDPDWGWLAKKSYPNGRYFDPHSSHTAWLKTCSDVNIEIFKGSHETLLSKENVAPIAYMVIKSLNLHAQSSQTV